SHVSASSCILTFWRQLDTRFFLVFFSLGSVPPRVLRSFPTRRSSDLWQRDPLLLLLASNGCESALLIPLTFGNHTPGALLLAHTDRKSTRLNSSHVSISYAVFCLKKKI